MSEHAEMPKAYEPEEIEKKWYEEWLRKEYFKGKVDPSKLAYSIAIPPPNVTGILTMGHVLNNTLQDILNRWNRMRGRSVCWFPGTDHAGIATESRVDKFLSEKEGVSRHDIGREKFVENAWEWKTEYGGTIIQQLKKLGSSCDWSRERFTLDEGLSHAVRKVFVDLYHKGYIYRGRRMVNWCPVSRSALSDEEVIYKEIDGNFYHFKYPLSDGSGHLEIATTRPETMLGDTAVAVHPTDDRYTSFIGKTVDLPLTGRKIPVVADEHADPTLGTGCVKITPAHDPNDFEVGQRHKLQILNVMNPDGTMNAAAGEEFKGLDRFECRKKIIKMMEERELVVKIEKHRHNVGYSERGDVPIEPMVSEQWFVNMKELAKPAMEAVSSGKIKFHPDRWTKVYMHWMENIRDWCISRQIWWGHRIPAWYNDATGEIHVGLEAPTQGGAWRQDEDVLDTWFSSWLWPFSIMGWPDKTAEQDYFYPTSDLVTGPDIIFFWVARMIMAGIEFKGEVPFRNVYFTSIIRDAQGRKLSKSLGNSPDPLEVIATYGADALRFAIIYIAPVGMDIRYSNEKCEFGRNFANKLWNACRFRTMQGGVTAGCKGLENIDLRRISPDDRWIISRLDETAVGVNSALERFRFHEATHLIYDFVWSEFCDWFIESSKTRLNSDDPAVKAAACQVLDYGLHIILRLLHPFMPYITEELAHHLGFVGDGETIMNSEFPRALSDDMRLKAIGDPALLELTNAKYEFIRAGRNLRASCGITPAVKLLYHVKAVDERAAAFLAAETAVMAKLMNAEKVVIDVSYTPDGPAPSILTKAGGIFMPLKGVIDIEAEKKKLAKQKKELAGWIAGAKAKLANERFMASAPQEVVDGAKEQLKELEERLARVEETLAALA